MNGRLCFAYLYIYAAKDTSLSSAKLVMTTANKASRGLAAKMQALFISASPAIFPLSSPTQIGVIIGPGTGETERGERITTEEPETLVITGGSCAPARARL